MTDGEARQTGQPEATSTNSYEQKFAELLRLLNETKEETILIHHPEVLGDNYYEIVESLNRIADAERELVILPRNQRTVKKLS